MQQNVQINEEVQAEEPKPFLWTKDEFFQLLDLGFFQDRRVQLIEGEILEMASQKEPHALGIGLTADALRAAFGPGYWVRVQSSLDLSPISLPDPDLAVVPGTPQQRRSAPQIPTTALLIVEVNLTTLSFDRRRKGSLYARAGIADYWIVNLVNLQLEVYRNPVADSTRLYGFRYADEQVLQPGDHVTPLAAPQASILVADLLP